MAYNVSDKYRNVIYSGNNDNILYVEYDGVEVENAPLLTESLSWTRNLLSNSSTSFSLDNFVSQLVQLIIHDFEVTDTSKEFYFKIGTMVDDNYEYVPIGYYHIKEAPTTTKGTTTYSLTDRSTYFDINADISSYIEEQGGSITKLQAVHKYCELVGVEFANDSFLGSDDSIGIYDNSITARQHIMYIAESAGCMATINRDGKLEFISIIPANDNNTITIPEKILNIQMENSKDTYKISKVLYEGALISYEKGDDTNDTLFINTSNIYISKQEDIDNIYDSINGLTIDNISTGSIIGDPSLDPWDYINYSNTDNDDNVVSTYTSLAQYTFTYTGVFTQAFETSVDADSKKINSTINSNSSKIRKLSQEIDTVEGTLRVTSEEVGEIQKEITSNATATGNPIEIEDGGNYTLEHFTKYGKCYQDSNEEATPDSCNPVLTSNCVENEVLITPDTYLSNAKYISGANTSEYTIESTIDTDDDNCIDVFKYIDEGDTWDEECGRLIPLPNPGKLNYIYIDTHNSIVEPYILAYDSNKKVVYIDSPSSSSDYNSVVKIFGKYNPYYYTVNFAISSATNGQQITFSPIVKALTKNKILSNRILSYIPYGKWLKMFANGKNLIKMGDFSKGDSFTVFGLTFNKNGDGSWVINGTASVTMEYSLRCYSEFYADKVTISNIDSLPTNSELDLYITGFNVSKSITASKNFVTAYAPTYTKQHGYINRISLYVKKGAIFDNFKLKVQLEIGDTATEIEDYKENSCLIDMNTYDDESNINGNYDLYSIGDTCDCIEDGMLYKKVEKIVLNEIVAQNYCTYDETLNALICSKVANEILTPSNEDEAPKLLCDYLIPYNYNSLISNTSIDGIAISSDGNLILRNTNLDKTLDAYVEWLTDTNVTIYYCLKEYLEYVLNYEDLTLFKGYNYISDNNYYNDTSITTEPHSEMELIYLRDTTLNNQYATKAELKITSNEITTELNQTITNKLEDYSTTTEITNSITQAITDNNENYVAIEVAKKVDEDDYTGASIIAKVNDDESSLTFKANKIALEGYTTINEGFSVDEKGNMTCNDAKMNDVSVSGGNIVLMEDTSDETDASLKIINPNNYDLYYSTYNITVNKNMSNEYLYFDNMPETDFITSDNDACNVLESSGGYNIYHEQYNGSQTEGWIEKVSLRKGTEELQIFYEYTYGSERTLNIDPYQLPNDFGTITSISSTCELFSENIILGATLEKNYWDYSYYSKDGISLGERNADSSLFKALNISGDSIETYHYGNSHSFLFNIDTSTDDPSNDSLSVASNLVNGELFLVQATGDTYMHNLIVEEGISITNAITNIGTRVPYGNIIYFQANESYIELQSDDLSDAYGINIWKSDKRLKSNIEDTKVKALDLIKQIKHREFTYKTNEDNLIKIGYIADELQEIDNQMIFEVGDNKMKQPQISYIVPLLTKAIQEQQSQIDDLKQQIEDLKNSIERNK